MKGSRILFISCFLSSLLFSTRPVFSQDRHITDTLEKVVISATRDIRNRTSGTGLKHLDSKTLDQSYAFLSNPDAIKIVQMLPGVMSGTELLSGLYVHGGDGADNLFLLDGIPLLQVTHFGGLFSTFNTDIIKSMNFYKSGFPAKFGGRLSSVLDILTSDGNANSYSGSFSIGLIGGRFSFQGPLIKNKMSFNIAIRRSWLDLISTPMLKLYNKGRANKTDGGYKFYDINANLLYIASKNDEMSLKIYMGKDNVHYSQSKQSKIYGKEIYFAESGDNFGIIWNNLASSFNWRHRFNDIISCNSRLFYTIGCSDGTIGSSGYDIVNETLSTKSEIDKTLSTIHNIGAANDFEFNFGTKYFNIGFLYQNSNYAPKSSKNLSRDNKANFYLSEHMYNTNEISVYAEGHFTFSSFALTTGMRLVYYMAEVADYFRFQPRIAANYQLNDNMEVTGSYSFMSQFSHLASSIYLDIPTNLWLPSTAGIKPSDSHQIAFDFLYRFSPKWKVNLGGYFRTLDNCLLYYGKPSWFISLDNWEKNMKTGKGIAYGTELELSYDTERLQAKMYYTLSWSKRLFRELYQAWFPDKFDNRHKITLVATYNINKNWELNTSWNYHSGNRITMPEQLVSSPDKKEDIILFSKPNNAKMPDYHRLDIGMNYKKKIRNRCESIWNISIYNVYCRLNPFIMGFSYAEDGRIVANVRSFIPIIPSFGYTIKF